METKIYAGNSKDDKAAIPRDVPGGVPECLVKSFSRKDIKATLRDKISFIIYKLKNLVKGRRTA